MSNEVDAYIAAAPKAAQPLLRQLRRMIKVAAPKAEERISYGMPYYHLQGRLAYFAAHKNHVGLYALDGGTLQLPYGEPLPAEQIGRLVRKRVAENLAKVEGPAGARPSSSVRSASRAVASGSRRASRS